MQNVLRSGALCSTTKHRRFVFYYQTYTLCVLLSSTECVLLPNTEAMYSTIKHMCYVFYYKNWTIVLYYKTHKICALLFNRQKLSALLTNTEVMCFTIKYRAVFTIKHKRYVLNTKYVCTTIMHIFYVFYNYTNSNVSNIIPNSFFHMFWILPILTQKFISFLKKF